MHTGHLVWDVCLILKTSKSLPRCLSGLPFHLAYQDELHILYSESLDSPQINDLDHFNMGKHLSSPILILTRWLGHFQNQVLPQVLISLPSSISPWDYLPPLLYFQSGKLIISGDNMGESRTRILFLIHITLSLWQGTGQPSVASVSYSLLSRTQWVVPRWAVKMDTSYTHASSHQLHEHVLRAEHVVLDQALRWRWLTRKTSLPPLGYWP